MNYSRAKEIQDTILSQVSHRISGRMAEELYQIYNTEVNPGRYKVIPCTCSPTIWKQMISETSALVTRVIEAWQAEPKKQKKSPTK